MCKRCVWLYERPDKTAAVAANKATRGEAALKDYVAPLEDAQKAGTPASVRDIELSRPYWFLLTADETKAVLKALGTAVQAAHAKGKASGSTGKASSSSSTPPPKKRKLGEENDTPPVQDMASKKATLLEHLVAK